MQYIGFGTIYVPIIAASPEIVHYKGVTCWLLFEANFKDFHGSQDLSFGFSENFYCKTRKL